MAGVGDITFFTDAETQHYVAEITAVAIMKAAGPMMLGLVVLEALLSLFRLQKTHRLSDTINSVSHGIIERAWSRLTSKTLEFGVYCYIYAHWAPYHFDENVWTGILAFVGVDMAYYWFHRMAHEINLFWATHSVHHSSEEYNLSTAMRQSIVQTYCSWMFYLPLAFIVPPRLFYVHLQINLLYQFWIHTKMVGRLGVLEWILNTPSHHRVHHGRNPRYLDRNYGGVLIIFDRMFGTFQEEDEEVYYGLVHTSQTFSLWSGQFAHFQYMIGRIMEEEGFWNKWAVVWKGPGWRAGAPRMGFASDIPEIDPHQGKYDPKLPTGHYWYLGLNFVSIVSFAIFVNMGFLQTRSHTVLTPKTQIMADALKGQGEATSFEEEIYLQPDGGALYLPSYAWHAILISALTWSLQSFSLISDNWKWAPHLEAFRCAFFLAVDVFCLLSAAPGEHRIFWYTDPAKRFTAWSAGFVLLRLDLLLSLIYMAHHIIVHHKHFDVPRRTNRRSTSPIKSDSSSQEQSEGVTDDQVSNVFISNKRPSSPQAEGGELESFSHHNIQPVAAKKRPIAATSGEKSGAKAETTNFQALNASNEALPTSHPLSPLEHLYASSAAGKQSSSPSSSPQTSSARRTKHRNFPVGVAI